MTAAERTPITGDNGEPDYVDSAGIAAMRWINAARDLDVPAVAGFSAALWADRMAGLMTGAERDAASGLALRAWRQRWWRGSGGRGRRMFHVLRSATAQADAARGDTVLDFAPMPLGAARAIVRKSTGLWEPGEARSDEWLATLPLYEYVRGCLLAVDILAWRRDRPQEWFSLTGAYDALGAEAALGQLREGGSVRVYAMPATWNRAGGGGAPGCLVFDWKSEIGRTVLLSGARLIGDDRAHALDLKRRAEKLLPKVAVATGRPGRARKREQAA